jgi:hypothetical protein
VAGPLTSLGAALLFALIWLAAPAAEVSQVSAVAGYLGGPVQDIGARVARHFRASGDAAPRERLVVVTPEAEVLDAVQLMVEQDVNQLPVIYGGAQLGLLTRGGLLRAIEHCLKFSALRAGRDRAAPSLPSPRRRTGSTRPFWCPPLPSPSQRIRVQCPTDSRSSPGDTRPVER